MAQSVLRYNVVIARKFFKGSWVSEIWRRDPLRNLMMKPTAHEKEYADKRREHLMLDFDTESAVCGLRAPTTTRRSADVCWKGKPKHKVCGPINQYD